MAKSPFAQNLDEVQKRIHAVLKPLGFSKHGRVFNRSIEDGVVQVIGLQMGIFPIGQQELPPGYQHLRPNLYGQFTVNLGVYVREISMAHYPQPIPRAVQDYHCAIRARLGQLHLKGENDLWWSLEASPDTLTSDLIPLIMSVGLPFLERFATRESIVRQWVAFNENEIDLSLVARVDVAIILAQQGRKDEARQLLREHLSLPSHNKGHPDYIRSLAQKRDLGDLGV